MSAQEDRPLFSFGVIADAQYTDMPDGDTEGRCQRFGEVPGKLRAALAELRAQHAATPLSCVLHLGDIINGGSISDGVAAMLLQLVRTAPPHLASAPAHAPMRAPAHPP